MRLRGGPFAFVLAAIVALACRGPRQWADPLDGSSSGGTDGRDTSGDRVDTGNATAGADGGTLTDGSSAGETAPPPPAANLRRLTVMLMGPGEIVVDEQPVPCPGTCVVDRPP